MTELGPPPAKKLRKGAERLTTHKKIIKLAEKLAVPEEITLDEFESFGNTVGLALRKLNEKQQAISQKLISEIIFLAKMNRLTENTAIVCNQFVPLTSPSQAGMDLSSPSVLSDQSSSTSSYTFLLGAGDTARSPNSNSLPVSFGTQSLPLQMCSQSAHSSSINPGIVRLTEPSNIPQGYKPASGKTSYTDLDVDMVLKNYNNITTFLNIV